jgi:hypothetical protein
MAYKFTFTDLNETMNSHIGNDTELDRSSSYIKKQKSIIKKNKKKVPEDYQPDYNKITSNVSGVINSIPVLRNESSNKEKEKESKTKSRYDEYGYFLHQKNLLDTNNTIRYVNHYINIDSRDRNKVPISVINNWYQLNNDPFTLENNSNLLHIKHAEHNFKIGDNICIRGLDFKRKIIKTKVGFVSYINFYSGSEYMTISIDLTNIIGNITAAIANEYDTTDMTVSISGVRGFPGLSYVQNIPLNYINTTHRIYLINPETGSFTQNTIYVKLPSAYDGDFSLNAYNIVFEFNNIAGVPIKYINANYPIDFKQTQGNHRIVAISDTGYYIELKKNAISSLTFGGNNIQVAKQEDIISGYSNPNFYELLLEKTYNNIINVRIINSLFPNTQQLVTDNNNKLYWQNLDDGDTVYSITITNGNYEPSGLITEIENKIKQVIRTDPAELGGILERSSYLNNNIIKLDINENTNEVIFNSYKESQLVKPLVSVSPSIPTGEQAISGITANVIKYSVTIKINNHSLEVGDTIIISGSIDYFGIPADVINGMHLVSNIIDIDRFEIILSHFNLQDIALRQDTGGGNAVTILVPNIFRLRFDYSNTIGNILGFRNTGQSTAITNYNTSISNNDAYYLEQTLDEFGNQKVIKSNSIRFFGYDYLYIVCPQLNYMVSNGKVKNSFYKIGMVPENKTDSVIKNTFVDTSVYYQNPIQFLDRLRFEFYTPDGDIFDFNGLDHSFVLEITTKEELPKGTNISQNTGKSN